jgi:nucleotide-binding universal stress UspA family protein
MFHKILVALDRSDLSPIVFATALDLAQASGASLLLVHALCPGDEAPNLPALMNSDQYSIGLNENLLEVYQDLWQTSEQQGLDMLKTYTQTALAAGVTTTFAQPVASPSRVICELAQEGIDLIVIGRRGYAGLDELFMGSVSHDVTHHANCSVFVVHAPKPEATTPPFTGAQMAIACGLRT